MAAHGPTFPEILRKLLAEGSISNVAHDETLANFTHVSLNRNWLERQHLGEWVASINGRFYFGPNNAELQALLRQLPDGVVDAAYIEHIVPL